VTIARKSKARQKRPKKAGPAPSPRLLPRPPERRRLVLALTVGEVAFALLLTWLLFRSGFVKHASVRVGLGAGEVFVVIAMGFCLAFFVFLLAFWQWRLSGRTRFRLVLAIYLSLLWSFCGLCWHDVTLRTADLAGPMARPALEQLREETLAVVTTMGGLLLGMIAVVIILILDRRAPRQPGAAN